MDGSSWERFEEGLGSTRASLKKRRRRLEQAGPVTCELNDGTPDFDEQFAEVLRIEAMGWKGEQGTAIASRPDTRQFYGAIAAWAAARGWLRLHLMRVDGAPIAVALGLEAHGTHASLKIGFDPAHSRGGPGVLLHEEMVRSGFERGLRRIELLGDEDEHKRTWTSATHELVELDMWAPTLAGRAGYVATTQIRPIASRFGLGRAVRAVRGKLSRGG
jgi:CelD/BcsL family acetyltransferase involved in cellulose biosynthesis